MPRWLEVGRLFQKQGTGRDVGQGHQAFDVLRPDDRGRDVGDGQVHVGQVGVGDRERLKGYHQRLTRTVGRNAGEWRIALVDLGRGGVDLTVSAGQFAVVLRYSATSNSAPPRQRGSSAASRVSGRASSRRTSSCTRPLVATPEPPSNRVEPPMVVNRPPASEMITGIGARSYGCA